MNWKCVLSDVDVICYQKKKKSYAIQIEARYSSESWKIYKSYYNTNGLSVTDTFEAKNREEMESVLGTLQSEKDPSLTELQKRMIEVKKAISLQLERAFKEYNVEKWFLKINNHSSKNFVLIRFYDDIEVDVVMDAQFSTQEEAISKELIKILGLQQGDEDVKLMYYYYNRSNSKTIEQKQPQVLFPQFELDWTDQ